LLAELFLRPETFKMPLIVDREFLVVGINFFNWAVCSALSSQHFSNSSAVRGTRASQPYEHVCDSLNIAITTSLTCVAYCSRETPGSRLLRVRASAAKSLTDRQLGKMNIHFGLIDAFSSKVLMHSLLWNPLVALTLHGFYEQCNLPW
jgi:hypothetical protein